MRNCWRVPGRGAITMPTSILVFSILLTEKLTVEKLTYVTVTGWYHRTFQNVCQFNCISLNNKLSHNL